MLLLPPSTLQGHHGLVDVLVALIVWPLGSFFKIYIPCNEAFFFILKSSNFLLWLSVLCYKYQEFQIVFLSRLAKREDSLLSRASDFLPINVFILSIRRINEFVFTNVYLPLFKDFSFAPMFDIFKTILNH